MARSALLEEKVDRKEEGGMIWSGTPTKVQVGSRSESGNLLLLPDSLHAGYALRLCRFRRSS